MCINSFNARFTHHVFEIVIFTSTRLFDFKDKLFDVEYPLFAIHVLQLAVSRCSHTIGEQGLASAQCERGIKIETKILLLLWSSFTASGTKRGKKSDWSGPSAMATENLCLPPSSVVMLFMNQELMEGHGAIIFGH